MLLPPDTLVAVADGEKFHLFRFAGNKEHSQLQAVGHPKVEGSNHSGGQGHSSSAANPDEKTDAEDMHAAATAAYLNREAMGNKFAHAVIIAPAKVLGELRKHYHKTLSAVLGGEVAKDLTGHSQNDIEKSIAAA